MELLPEDWILGFWLPSCNLGITRRGRPGGAVDCIAVDLASASKSGSDFDSPSASESYLPQLSEQASVSSSAPSLLQQEEHFV